MGLTTSHCSWILDFLTGTPQSVSIGQIATPLQSTAQITSNDTTVTEQLAKSVYCTSTELWRETNVPSILMFMILDTTCLAKKAQQRLHFLQRLKRVILPPPIVTIFYRGTIKSVLTAVSPWGMGTAWSVAVA